MLTRDTTTSANTNAAWRIRDFLWILPILLMTNVEGDSIQAQYLRSSRRFHPSPYMDSVYCCNVCGGGIQWVVDQQDAGGHLLGQTAGAVSFRTEYRDSTTLRYTSILLSTRSENDSMCMDVVLLVSQPESEYFAGHPEVICRGRILQSEIQMPSRDILTDQITTGTVTLMHLLGWSNIVSPGNNFVTHIFLCSTNESAQFWRHNEQSAGGFNGVHTAGSSKFKLHSSDPFISSQEAVLLVKRPVDLTSILILTDVNSSINFTVLCASDTSYIRTEMNDSYIQNGLKQKVMTSTFTSFVTGIVNATTEELSRSSDSVNTTNIGIIVSGIIVGTIILISFFSAICIILWSCYRRQLECRNLEHGEIYLTKGGKIIYKEHLRTEEGSTQEQEKYTEGDNKNQGCHLQSKANVDDPEGKSKYFMLEYNKCHPECHSNSIKEETNSDPEERHKHFTEGYNEDHQECHSNSKEENVTDCEERHKHYAIGYSENHQECYSNNSMKEETIGYPDKRHKHFKEGCNENHQECYSHSKEIDVTDSKERHKHFAEEYSENHQEYHSNSMKEETINDPEERHKHYTEGCNENRQECSIKSITHPEEGQHLMSD